MEAESHVLWVHVKEAGIKFGREKKRILMLTLKQADVLLEYKARVDSFRLILGRTLTGS